MNEMIDHNFRNVMTMSDNIKFDYQHILLYFSEEYNTKTKFLTRDHQKYTLYNLFYISSEL